MIDLLSSLFLFFSVSVLPDTKNHQSVEYRCVYCNYLYSSSSHLKKHQKMGCFMDPSFPIEVRRILNKKRLKNYVCPKCSLAYKNKRSLNTHLRTVCGLEPRFRCPYCNLKSKYSHNIYTHIRRNHKGEDLFLIDEQH